MMGANRMWCEAFYIYNKIEPYHARSHTKSITQRIYGKVWSAFDLWCGLKFILQGSIAFCMFVLYNVFCVCGLYGMGWTCGFYMSCWCSLCGEFVFRRSPKNTKSTCVKVVVVCASNPLNNGSPHCATWGDWDIALRSSSWKTRFLYSVCMFIFFVAFAPLLRSVGKARRGFFVAYPNAHLCECIQMRNVAYSTHRGLCMVDLFFAHHMCVLTAPLVFPICICVTCGCGSMETKLIRDASRGVSIHDGHRICIYATIAHIVHHHIVAFIRDERRGRRTTK